MAMIKIDGVDYDTDHLSDNVKSALNAVQFTEIEIQRLQAKLAALQTARITYVNALKQGLEKQKSSSPMSMLQGDTIQFS